MRTLSLLAFLSLLANAQDGTIHLSVDATGAPQRLFHIQMAIPAKPGPMTLLYPKWIPGEHAPSGPVIDLVGLKITANGQTIPWRRDSINMFAFHLTVPEAATSLDVVFDFISPPDTAGFSSGASATSELVVLNWNQVLLYPEGADANHLTYQANLRAPNSWRYGTALPVARESGNEIEFQPAPLNTLIDSPVSAGLHYRTIDLGADGSIVHYLHLAGDSEHAIEISPEQVQDYRNLVSEAGALFGSRHYRSYHFLFTLSDYVASFGLEHHESSDDRIRERGLIDEAPRKANADLLPHEFVHSWNGKYRRPAGLVDPDYSQPMKGDLLWIYEGLTQYLGAILTCRTGLYSPEEFRESIAIIAASLDRESGRKWRPLEDTAVAAQLLYDAREDYAGLRRGVDFYDEGTLLWLDVDVLIRQLSHGTKSLTDFCHLFYGGPSGAPLMKPYTLEDVVSALNSVQPYDWSAFLWERVQTIRSHPPLGGIENGGWKLIYNSNRSDLWRDFEEEKRQMNLMYSIGLLVGEDGTIADVAMGGPAQTAGVAPNDKIIAVDNRQFTPAVLREEVQRSASAPQTIELLVKNGEYYRVHRIAYQGGEKYPHLVRDPDKPDILGEIIRPLANH